ncbi:hypothetical protein IE077_003540, partial [Cardiosporidium cionae]
PPPPLSPPPYFSINFLQVPTSLIPRFPVDWRNGGRALLCAAMALLEGFRLHRHRQSLEWQRRGLCEGRCRSDCAKSSWRCLCAWRAVGIYKHYRAMDGLFISYKGFISTKKPLFTVPRFVAKQNGRNSVPLRWDPLMKTYTFLSPHLPLDERFEHADRHHFIRGFDTMKSFSGYTSDAVLTESDISESDTEDIS